MALIERVGQAAAAVIRNFGPDSFRSHRFRTFSIAALDYIASTNGIEFTRDDKQRLDVFLELGILINDNFDLGQLNHTRYSELRRNLQHESATVALFREYWGKIRFLERTRPKPGQEEKCIAYREATNLVSIAACCSASFNIPVGEFVDGEMWDSFSDKCPNWFKGLFFSVMALQVVDDMVGWRGDQKANRPSFFTAKGLVDANKASVINNRHEEMSVYFKKYADLALHEGSDVLVPIIGFAYGLKFVLPGFMEQIKRRRVSSPNPLFSSRDIKEQ